ncbi:MAG: hypothetical protein JXR73_03970 [Candidatus Omnitrophica bacterium]|nr:hypothetical protein [Candidatus Omnitrophota bacterium]
MTVSILGACFLEESWMDGVASPSANIAGTVYLHMSKRIDAYHQGMKRLTSFMEMFLTDGEPPSPQQIDEEYRAIDSLRNIPYRLHAPETPIDFEGGFFVLIGEEYERYDDALPAFLQVCFLPASMDSSKEINRFLTMLPIQ